jgi:hypothetical protein
MPQTRTVIPLSERKGDLFFVVLFGTFFLIACSVDWYCAASCACGHFAFPLDRGSCRTTPCHCHGCRRFGLGYKFGAAAAAQRAPCPTEEGLSATLCKLDRVVSTALEYALRLRLQGAAE